MMKKNVITTNLRYDVHDIFEENRPKPDMMIYEFSKLLNIDVKCYETLLNIIILLSVEQIDEHIKDNEN